MYLSDKFAQTEWFDFHDWQRFRLSVVRGLLFLSFVFTGFIATLALAGWFPLPAYYIWLLYGYALVSGVLYYFKARLPYVFLKHTAVLASLALFVPMTVDVHADEFRFVWYYLTVFVAFVLGGRWYGITVSIVSIVLVSGLYLLFDTGMSPYALFTFVCAMAVFDAFIYIVLLKIERDEDRLFEKVEEEIAKRQEQEALLLRRYRMENMGDMINAIAHQWRQPLMQSNMIIFNLQEELKEMGIYSDKIARYSDEMVDLNAYMSQTIDDFRKMISQEKPKAHFEAEETVREVLHLMRTSLQDINVTLSNGTHTLYGYKSEFVQVLITLLSNAKEALETRRIYAPRIRIEIKEKERHIEVSVADNAGGVPAELREKIFDPYFTTKSQTGGTGTGLYIARIITERYLGGTLTCSNDEEGARFIIRMPYG